MFAVSDEELHRSLTALNLATVLVVGVVIAVAVMVLVRRRADAHLSHLQDTMEPTPDPAAPHLVVRRPPPYDQAND